MTQQPTFLRVAIPTPLRRVFDYLPPHNSSCPPVVGMRVRVPFGRQTVVGVVVAITDNSDAPANKLRHAQALLDDSALLPPDLMQLLQWASHYYQHPLGEVVDHALPGLLRKGHAPHVKGIKRWQLSAAGQAVDPDSLHRAPKQQALLNQLQRQSEGLLAAELDAQHENWRSVMARLVEKGWVEITESSCLPEANSTPHPSPELNTDQQAAVDSVTSSLDQYQSFLLDGVTGSGKTEVYLNIIETVIAQGRQAMVLVPEIGLTPQLVERFRQRLPCPIAVLHSGLNDQERLCAWLAAAQGSARVIIGTRSALFTPLPQPGVFIIDEEHDLSFKQQDGFRYHARDLAIVRARQANVPIVLGSATPSLESLYNVTQQRYQCLHLPQRAGAAIPPHLQLLDVRSQKMDHALSAQLLTLMKQHLAQQGQVLLFLNRRGFAPVLMCHDCGWHSTCQRCDAHMTLHQRAHRLRCHHCGAERPVDPACPECGSANLHGMGVGTEKVEQALSTLFPEQRVIRIDRDTTRRKGAMQAIIEDIHAGRGDILLGTQMLAKGHHFPNVTLVALLDADHGLYSADFRASERMGQLILQVAGRAGRAERPGEVVIQTHHPDNPLLQTLISQDYHRFADTLSKEREQTQLPPYSHLALLRAEAVSAEMPLQFLQQAKQLAEQFKVNQVMLLGPVPAPMERRAGRLRAQLLLQAASRSDLQLLLTPWLTQLEALPLARKVRWSIDVDPMEMY